MIDDDNQVVYAHVILHPASGMAINDDAEITSANIGLFTPSARDVNLVVKYFQQAGFKTAGLTGISIDISGPVRLFEQFFKCKLDQNERGTFFVRSQESSYELPSSVLSKEISVLIKAIALPERLDFGPSGSF